MYILDVRACFFHFHITTGQVSVEACDVVCFSPSDPLSFVLLKLVLVWLVELAPYLVQDLDAVSLFPTTLCTLLEVGMELSTLLTTNVARPASGGQGSGGSFSLLGTSPRELFWIWIYMYLSGPRHLKLLSGTSPFNNSIIGVEAL